MRRRSRCALVLMLVLVLAPLSALGASGAAVPLSGSFLFDEAALEGVQFEGPAMFFGVLEPGSDAGAAVFVLDAPVVDVVVHRNPYATTTGPVRPNLATFPDGNESTDEPVRHENVTATSFHVRPSAFLQAEGPAGPGRPSTFDVKVGAARVEPRDRLDFQWATDEDSGWEPSRHGPWPNLLVSPSADAIAWLRGDFVLTFYEFDVHLEADDGSTTYRTGDIRSNQTPATGEPVYMEGELRRIDIVVHDGALAYHPNGYDFQVRAHSGTLVADGAAVFSGASGSIVGVNRSDFQGTRLALDGYWEADLLLESRGVRADLEAREVRSASLGGQELAFVASRPPLEGRSWSRIGSGVALGLAVLAGLVVRIRSRRLDSDTLVMASHWALEVGKVGRADRWARRALVHNPGDSDAAVLHAVGLYRLGRHEEAVRWLRVWISEHGDATGAVTLALGLGILEVEGVGSAAGVVQAALGQDASLRSVLRGGAEGV